MWTSVSCLKRIKTTYNRHWHCRKKNFESRHHTYVKQRRLEWRQLREGETCMCVYVQEREKIRESCGKKEERITGDKTSARSLSLSLSHSHANTHTVPSSSLALPTQREGGHTVLHGKVDTHSTSTHVTCAPFRLSFARSTRSWNQPALNYHALGCASRPSTTCSQPQSHP